MRSNGMARRKCIALFSGGLDSLLAVRVMRDAGVEVKILNFNIGFYFSQYEKKGNVLIYKGKVPEGYDIEVVDISGDFYEMIKNPAHGFGKNMNPCIDCKIFMLKKAKELLSAYGAGFVITGEVLGQRPMTQNPRAMKLIEKESGLEGFLLRPLCAKKLQPTEPEKLGWVDREKMLGISGRSRKEQLALAEKWGMSDYVKTPAGGCILTDKEYSARLRDFLVHQGEDSISADDVFLLTKGRHFRRDKIKFIIGRNKSENEALIKYAGKGVLFECKKVPGPAALGFGDLSAKDKEFIAAAAAGYSDGRDMEEVEITINNSESIRVKPLTLDEIKKYFI